MLHFTSATPYKSMKSCSFCSVFFFYSTKGTTPAQIWLNDLGALDLILDEIAEIERKQDIEDDKQRKKAGKRTVTLFFEFLSFSCVNTGRYQHPLQCFIK